MLLNNNQESIKATLDEFSCIDGVIIDASSIIYMHKAGYLKKLSKEIKLYSIQEVMGEAGISFEVEILEFLPTDNLSNDNKLVLTAEKNSLPVISEDKKVLMHIKKAELYYFNSLMMLAFLLFRGSISIDEYKRYLYKLEKIARYSDYVWNYGDALVKVICSKNKDNDNIIIN